MRKKHPDRELQFSEYADYLVRTSLADERRVRYYVHWVRRFFNASADWPAESWQAALQRYVNALNDDQRVADWQVEQAERAVRLHFHNFRSTAADETRSSPVVQARPDGEVNRCDLLAATRDASQRIPVRSAG